MNSEEKIKAQQLYAQTEMSVTQIAIALGIGRTSLHQWIKDGSWERLKKNAEVLPALVSEQCYHVIGQFTEGLLNEERANRPVTQQEADTLHKLVWSLNKLKTRSPLNESIELMGTLIDKVYDSSPELAYQLKPIIDEHLASKADVNLKDTQPKRFMEKEVTVFDEVARLDNSELQRVSDLCDRENLSPEDKKKVMDHFTQKHKEEMERIKAQFMKEQGLDPGHDTPGSAEGSIS